MPLNLTDLGEIKRHLSVTGNDSDSLYEHLAMEAEAGFAAWTKRKIYQASETRYYNGHGRERLILSERPITAAEVYVDAGGYAGQASGAFASDTQWTQGVDFYIASVVEDESNPGELIAINQPWPCGRGNIKVVQTSGYTTIPGDIAGAIHRLVARLNSDRKKGRSFSSERLGGYAYSLISNANDDELLRIRDTFTIYRRLC